MHLIRPGRKVWLAINVVIISLLMIGYRFGLLLPLFSDIYRLLLFAGVYNLFFALSIRDVREWGDAYTVWGLVVNVVVLYAAFFSVWGKYLYFFMFYVILGIFSSFCLSKRLFKLLFFFVLLPGLYLASAGFDLFLLSTFVVIVSYFFAGRMTVRIVSEEDEDWRKTSDRLLEQMEVLRYNNRRLEMKLAAFRKKVEDMEVLQRVRNILTRYEWDEAIGRALRILKNFNNASFVALFAVDALNSEVKPAYYVGNLPLKDVRKGEGVVGRAWSTERVVISVRDEEKVRVCFPLKTSERFLGMLCMDRWRWYPDRRMAVHFLRPVADDIASFWQMQLWKKRVYSSLREADLLYRITFLLTTKRSEKELINAILDMFFDEFNCSAATYFSWSTREEKLVPFITRGSSRPVNINTDKKFRAGEGIAAIAAVQKKTVAVNNVKGAIGIRSIAAVPILSAGKVIGVLTIARRDVDSFEEDEVRLLELAGMQMAYMMEKIRLYQLLEKMAILDGLTGVYNHRYFEIRFTEELKKAKRYNFPLSLAIFDIDYFKKFNDTYGHQVGDLVLKHVVEVIKDTVRDIDIVARYGGEEFVVVLPYASRSDAIVVADRVRESVQKSPIGVEGQLLSVTISGGVSSYPEDVDDADELIRIADKRLYEAKESGRNMVKG